MMRREATLQKRKAGITEIAFAATRNLVRGQAAVAALVVVYGAVVGLMERVDPAFNFITESFGMLLVMEVISYLLPFVNVMITKDKR